MGQELDLAVVGGGPGGAAAALAAAAQGLCVAVFDPRVDDIDKPCGEGMLPAGVDALAELGLSRALDGARRFDRLRYCVPDRKPFEIPLPRPGMALQRPLLQSELARALRRRSRVTVFPRRVETARDPRGFLLRAGDEVHRARTLVAADGVGGRAADWLRTAGFASARCGIRARYAAARPLDTVEVHLGNGCEVYLTPLPGALVNAAFLFERPPAGVHGSGGLVEWALARHPEAAAWLGAPVTRPELRPLERRRATHLALDGAFLVGDAGRGVDPIIGCGVTVALRTGILAGRAAACVVGGAPRGQTEHAYVRAYRRETRLRRALAWSLRQVGSHTLLLSGVAAIGGLAPALLTPLVRIASGGSRPRPSPR